MADLTWAHNTETVHLSSVISYEIAIHFPKYFLTFCLSPRRPLITFPMTQEGSKNFNLARKYKVNQQILDGFLDPGEAISAPSVFVSKARKLFKNIDRYLRAFISATFVFERINWDLRIDGIHFNRDLLK